MYFSVEVEAKYKIYHAIEQTDDILINKNGSCVKSSNENQNCKQDENSKQGLH
jgi:hypothetical protein